MRTSRRSLFVTASLFLSVACSDAPGDEDDPGAPSGTCPSGQAECSGACVQTSSVANCGACGVACTTGQSCDGVACQCDAGLSACREGCVDVLANAQNCGACGSACGTEELCSAGACIPAADGCPLGQTACAGACVATDTNAFNCGACGTACAAGQTCAAGACQCSVGTACASGCTDTLSDVQNCGACDAACTLGQTCEGGACVGASTGGSTSSGGSTSGSGGGASVTVTIEEGQPGQCSVDGAIEADNSGFTGSGYLNTDNSAGASIEWSVNVAVEGNYLLDFAYANETEDRPADVLVGGSIVSGGVSFPSTSSWTAWSTSTVSAQLALGENRIVLRASRAVGLANIDHLTVTGAAVSAGDCGATGTGGAVGTGGSSGGTGGEVGTGGDDGSGGTTDPPAIGPATCGCETPAGEWGTVNSTIIVDPGEVYDGNCMIYRANPSTLGDGSQSESQSPVFRIEDGGTLRNVVLGASAADGIHTHGDATIENVHVLDIGEDAFTVKESGTVRINCGSAFNGSDKVMQVNAASTVYVSNFTAGDAGKFMRQNGGTTFEVNVFIDHCDIYNMSESIFRTDSSSSHVTLSNTRYRNIGDSLFIFGSNNVSGNSGQSTVENNQQY